MVEPSQLRVHVLVDDAVKYSFTIRGPWNNGSVINKLVQYVPGRSSIASTRSRAICIVWKCTACDACVDNIKKYINYHGTLLRNGYGRRQQKFTISELCTDCFQKYGLSTDNPVSRVTLGKVRSGQQHIVEKLGTMDVGDPTPDENDSDDSVRDVIAGLRDVKVQLDLPL